jgi:DNA-binding transcriptional regulator YdaS (Cro superfamily)
LTKGDSTAYLIDMQTHDTSSPLDKAIAAVGSASALARALGITRMAVAQWKKVPAERVLEVEKATRGKVKRYELRPDLYPPPRRRQGAEQ